MESSFTPSVGQQKFLSIGFVPSSLLSILGSSLIIANIRHEQRKTPYRSIMLCLSICDIISSISWIFQPFLTLSKGDDAWVWSVGNDATCNVLGAMTQFGFSAHWYSGLLSFYFLFTVRFGIQQLTFGRYLPYIHVFIFTWSVGTAIAGVALGAYGPIGVGPGCWVAGDHDCAEDCIHGTVGWIMGGIPLLLMMMCVIVNNPLLYCYVRGTISQGQRRALEAQQNNEKHRTFADRRIMQADNTWSSELPMGLTPRQKPLEKGETAETMQSTSSNRKLISDVSSTTPQVSMVRESFDKQRKLVQEVGKQSFLYVGAYLLTFGSSFAINTLDSKQYEYRPGIGKVFLPLLILQSIFLPAQGFFNSVIFFRSKYAATRIDYPNESRIWCMQRSVFGNKIYPRASVITSTPYRHSAVSKPRRSAQPSSFRINHAGQMVMSTLDQAFCSEDDRECTPIDEKEEEEEPNTNSSSSFGTWDRTNQDPSQDNTPPMGEKTS